MKLPGSATAAGTQRYRQRFDGEIPPEHFHQIQGLWMSSIGIGTYLGNHDEATDRQYSEAIVRAVESGCNVIDSAINYRCQRSERSIGAALKELTAKGYGRDEVIIATKGGFLPFDGTPPERSTQLFYQDIYRHRAGRRAGYRRRLPLHDAALFIESTGLQPAQSRPRMRRYLLRAQPRKPVGKDHPRRVRRAVSESI